MFGRLAAAALGALVSASAGWAVAGTFPDAPLLSSAAIIQATGAHRSGRPEAGWSDRAAQQRRTLEGLAQDRVPVTHKGDAANVDRLFAALGDLSARAGNRQPTRRLTGMRQIAAPDGMADFVASVTADLQEVARDARPQRTVDLSIEVSLLHQALRGFAPAEDGAVSSVFSRVYLGIEATAPRLSQADRAYSRVAKEDSRESLAAARLHSPLEGPVMAASDVPPVNHVPVVGSTRGETQAPVLAVELDALPAALGEGELHAMVPVSSAVAAGLVVDPQLRPIEEIEGIALAGLEAIAEDELQAHRAGFLLDNGVRIDFSVTRLSVVDGVERLQMVTNLPQSLDQAALAQVSAEQVGSARLWRPSDGSAALSIIQNEFDNRRILDVTTLDVNIHNFGLRSLKFIPPSLQRDAIPAVFR